MRGGGGGGGGGEGEEEVDLVCLSRTHDKDYEELMRGGEGGGSS